MFKDSESLASMMLPTDSITHHCVREDDSSSPRTGPTSSAPLAPAAVFHEENQLIMPESDESTPTLHMVQPNDVDSLLSPQAALPADPPSSNQSPQVIFPHSMTTRSHHGIVKPNPKYALSTTYSSSVPREPRSVQAALAHPGFIELGAEVYCTRNEAAGTFNWMRNLGTSVLSAGTTHKPKLKCRLHVPVCECI
uniref:Uncharacterized protein n=1 Tax=Populus alba TaxID=43335 RepID=A0A4U5M9F5_POPAL|nr:hypothetical protein D5086_0000319190 [Populus alba]